VKICQVLAGNEDGGLEKHTIELSYELQKNGIDVTVIAHQDFEDDFKGIDFIPLDLSKSRNNIYILWKLLKSIKDISPDIVHTQANKATAMVSKIKPFLSSKLVATLHSQKRNIKAYENFDYIIGVSHRVLASIDNPSKRVIYNGIDIPKVIYDELFWDRFGISKESFVISAIGRLESVKNFPMLIESISELPVELVIVGDGSKRDELEEMVKRLNISSKVHFLGFREDVNDILYHSRLSVISSDREGFSYVMAEALLLEKPIISTDVGDMKKILPQEYVVPVGDVDAMKNTILKFLNKYDESLEEFRGSFEFAKDKFTLSNMTKETIDVYKRVLR